MKVSVIIPAGGVGHRFGGEKPKQFIELNGIPILVRTIKCFEDIEDVESIVVAVHTEWFSHAKQIIKDFDCKKVKEVVLAGKERQDSIANALHTPSVEESELVVIHDANRPFVKQESIEKIIEAAEEQGAVVSGIKSVDVVKEKNSKAQITRTFEQDGLVRIQTPEAYWTDIIVTAYKKALEVNYRGADTSHLVEFIGYKVTVLEGDDSNIKITTPFDLRVAELLHA